VVLYRKNALFYRTLNGAQVGNLFMSLIHTCELCGDPFDYLTELQRHSESLKRTRLPGCLRTTAAPWFTRKSPEDSSFCTKKLA
jgi:hypothetical protein